MKRKILLIALFTIFAICFLEAKSYAATTYKEIKGQATNNVSSQNYTKWTKVINSYLYEDTDKAIIRVEYLPNESKILIENYDSTLNLKSQKKLDMSLPIFGGFYSGTQYNFIVLGQNNLAENNSIPVYMIEKYSKNWEKLQTADLTNCNTTKPFDAGTCRMVEINDKLCIETSHEMYKTDDGKNHQSNLGIEVDISTMNIIYSRTEIFNPTNGYISHSFNQFIQVEGNNSYTVNHGDAVPRAIALTSRKIGEENATTISAVGIGGDVGDNNTGLSVGGFELSANKCIIVGNSIDQAEQNWNPNGTRNIFVRTITKDLTSANGKWLTNYSEGSNVTVSTPHLVKINNNKFAIMWEEWTGQYNYEGVIKVALIDEDMNQIGETITIGGRLSDCKPIVSNNNIIWYVTMENRNTIMFSIDISSEETLKKSNGQNLLSTEAKTLMDHFYHTISYSGEIVLGGFDNKLKSVDFASIKLPSWLYFAKINVRTFENCTMLETIKWPATVETIEYRTFERLYKPKRNNNTKHSKRNRI